uniref:Secreted protein n=1 Tax=Globodera pallida TaxID=36090 RepID=A0A183BUY6_GLOPA
MRLLQNAVLLTCFFFVVLLPCHCNALTCGAGMRMNQRQLIRQCHFSSIPSAAFFAFGTLFLLIWWLSMGFSSVNNSPIVNQTFTIKPLIASQNTSTDAKVSLQSKNEHLAAAFGSLWPKLSQLNCNSLITNGTKFKQFGGGKRRRIVQTDPPHGHLDTNCTAIRARWHFVETAGTAREANFPLAFARTVFRYAPQNVYCYALDAKADALFMRRVHALAHCFPNVVVLAEQFSVFSNGKNVTRAQLACLEAMLPMGEWKYALLLQNHDLPLRTNAEMVEILRVYNGTNDIGTKKIVPNSVNLSLDWSLASLNIYREGHRVPMPTNLTRRLHHTKSLNLIALSRSAVEFTLGALRLDKMIAQLELSAYGMDEVLFSTLNSNLPDFPGGFSPICLPRRPNHDLPLRTNAEMVEILRVYNGTNDIGTKKIVPNTVNLSLDWSLASLNIYRAGHHRVPMPTNLTRRLHHTKSLNLIALSRSAVEFTIGTLRLDKMIAQLELSAYGMDEVLFSTLNSNLPEFPGGFSPICLPRRPVPNMGRYTIWHGNGVATASGGCRSAFFRHGVCVYGTEDLSHIGRDRLLLLFEQNVSVRKTERRMAATIQSCALFCDNCVFLEQIVLVDGIGH